MDPSPTGLGFHSAKEKSRGLAGLGRLGAAVPSSWHNDPCFRFLLCPPFSPALPCTAPFQAAVQKVPPAQTDVLVARGCGPAEDSVRTLQPTSHSPVTMVSSASWDPRTQSSHLFSPLNPLPFSPGHTPKGRPSFCSSGLSPASTPCRAGKFSLFRCGDTEWGCGQGDTVSEWQSSG